MQGEENPKKWTALDEILVEISGKMAYASTTGNQERMAELTMIENALKSLKNKT